MSLAQIRYFVAVAEEGHVGRAAEGLRVAQPAVSRQIKNLEDELGARLFVRTSRGMHLAPPGEAFLPHARALLAGVEAAARAAIEAASVDRGGPLGASAPASPLTESSSAKAR